MKRGKIKEHRISDLRSMCRHFEKEIRALSHWCDAERLDLCGPIAIEEMVKMKRQAQATLRAVEVALARELDDGHKSPEHLPMKTRSFVIQSKNENPKRGS